MPTKYRNSSNYYRENEYNNSLVTYKNLEVNNF